VITQAHTIDRFSVRQLADALLGQSDALKGQRGYASINWNYLPSSGASLVHPHMQGLVDDRPSALADNYIRGSGSYLKHCGKCYWDVLHEHELNSERFLFGDEVCWIANAVPLGEKEVRGLLPVSSLNDWEPWIESVAEGLVRVIDLYRALGTYAFNISLFFGREDGSSKGFRAFCSIIARINPNIASLSDSAFMERLHREPVILTFPEDLASQYRMHAAINEV
jgi:galactose-1-phosphate uridylyltransferase